MERKNELKRKIDEIKKRDATKRKNNPYIKPQQITEIRERLNLTQAQFSEVVGTTQPVVCQWEGGRFHPNHKYREVLNELATIAKVTI